MPPIFETLPHNVGDYELYSLLDSHADRDLYWARQNHVERAVALEVLHPKASKEQKQQFIASARAQGANPTNRVMPVFEAMEANGYWIITQEMPAGKNLEEIMRSGEQLSVIGYCKLIEQIAEIYKHYDTHGVATNAFTRCTVFQKEDGDFHFISPVITGERTAENSMNNMIQLSKILRPILPYNVSGQTRVATLNDWLEHGFEGEVLSWSIVGSTAGLIIEQIDPSAAQGLITITPSAIAAKERRRQRQRNKYKRRMAIVAGCVLLTALTSSFISIYFIKRSQTAPENKEDIIVVYENQSYILDRSPVSISEYKEFLEAYDKMSPPQKSTLFANVKGPTSPHLRPLNWEKVIKYCQSSNNPSKAMTQAVRGLTQWDAICFARYKQSLVAPFGLLLAYKKDHSDIKIEEWTNLSRTDPIHGTVSIAICPDGKSIREPYDSKRSIKRSFRLAKPINP